MSGKSNSANELRMKNCSERKLKLVPALPQSPRNCGNGASPADSGSHEIRKEIFLPFRTLLQFSGENSSGIDVKNFFPDFGGPLSAGEAHCRSFLR